MRLLVAARVGVGASGDTAMSEDPDGPDARLRKGTKAVDDDDDAWTIHRSDLGMPVPGSSRDAETEPGAGGTVGCPTRSDPGWVGPQTLTPRALPLLEDIDACVATAKAAEEAKEAAAARQAVVDQSSPLPWADIRNGESVGNVQGNSLEDAAFFVGWRVVDVRTGVDIGDVTCALGMAGGEVIAQMGSEEEGDEEDDEGFDVDDAFLPQGSWDGRDVAEDRDDDDGDWEVIYEGEEGSNASGWGDDGIGGEFWGEAFDGEGAEEEGFGVEGSGSFDDEEPPMSFLLRVRGMREVEGAGGVVNLTPVLHLVPLVPDLFPRWNQYSDPPRLVMDPPQGLLELGLRRSEIRALRRDLLPYCSRVNATELGMPQRRTLVRAGRSDLAARISALGDWPSVSVMLNLVSKRKPDGYWENIDLLRDALLQLVHAFWFKEVDEETGQVFFYNDISGALTFDEPDELSGGGLDIPVMPSMVGS